MASTLLASWYNEKYSKIATSIGTTTAISTGITARTVTRNTTAASATSINNLINDINGLKSNVFLRHATAWTNNTPATTTSKRTAIDEDLKTKIDNLISEFEQMCGNNASYNGHTSYRYYTGDGQRYSYSTGFGRSSGNGQSYSTGDGQSSFECCYAASNNFHTCTNFASNSTRSTGNNTRSNSTRSTDYGNSTSAVRFTHTKATYYNFSVLANNGSVSNSNATRN